MSLLATEKWESGKVHLADSGDMVRSKQERFVANLLTSEGISFEYERKLSSWDGSFRYPDFTLFINGEQYYWEHWGMVDDYSYRQSIAKRIRWYREHGYYDYLIQTWGWGWGDRDLRGQVLAELSKLRKRKRRKSGYKPVSDSHVDWQKTAHEAKREFTWGRFIFFAVVLSLFLFLSVALFSSRQVPNPVTMSEVPKTVLQKPESEKKLQTVKRPHSTTQEVKTGEPITEKKEKKEMFYMGIKISR